MKESDRKLFQQCHRWLAEGHIVYLLTVIKTWGSSPRPVGSLAAIREDGLLAGSVSGGCIEEQLAAQLAGTDSRRDFPAFYTFGDTPETARLIPCQSTLEILVEKITDPLHFLVVLDIDTSRTLSRAVNIHTGEVRWEQSGSEALPEFEKTPSTIVRRFTRQWKLVLFGYTPVSQALYRFATASGFEVVVCDPREGYDIDGQMPIDKAMPDELVLKHNSEFRTAFIALSHDPKIDDMALMEALKSKSFYVGAMGSKTNNASRRERLASLDLTPQQIHRLHGPVGLPINSKTPEEIAVSILAHVIQEKNGLKKPGEQ